MTANPLKPVRRYRPGEAIVEEQSSSEDEGSAEEEASEQRVGRQTALLEPRSQPAKSKALKVEDASDDEEGFVTEDEEDVERSRSQAVDSIGTGLDMSTRKNPDNKTTACGPRPWTSRLDYTGSRATVALPLTKWNDVTRDTTGSALDTAQARRSAQESTFRLLQPTLTFPYRYQELSSSGDSIRLLKLLPGDEDAEIECRLAEVSLQSRSSYDAVSYRWGVSPASGRVRIDDRTIQVRETLWWLHYYLRCRSAARTLWIDAICIEYTQRRGVCWSG
jgi:hypothetical protein